MQVHRESCLRAGTNVDGLTAGGHGDATGFRTYINQACEAGHKRKATEVANLAEAPLNRSGTEVPPISSSAHRPLSHFQICSSILQ